MRLAWFSPLNTAGVSASAAAYFSDVVLDELRSCCIIDLFGPTRAQYRGAPVHSYLMAAQRHELTPYDACVYHLENGAHAAFVRMHLGLLPGVTVFHDFVMRDFGPEPIHNSGWRTIIEKFQTGSGTWPVRGADHGQKGPHAYRESALTVVPIFTAEKDHADYQRLVTTRISDGIGSAVSHYLPYPVVIPSVSPVDTRPQQVAFMGTPGVEHRAAYLLAAMERFPQVVLQWMVADAGEESAARELLKEFPTARVEFTHGRSPEAWRSVVSQSAAAVHTFFSAYGQTGPWLPISLAHGVPCLVSDYGGSDYLPSCVLRIRPGVSEGRQIGDALQRVFSGAAAEEAAAGAHYAAEAHDARAVADEFLSVLERSRPLLQEFSRRWREFEQTARESMLSDSRA